MNKTLASLVIIAFLLCPLYTGCGPKNTELADAYRAFPNVTLLLHPQTAPYKE